jgi:NifU-like protein involved in Fe-S cluster formation
VRLDAAVSAQDRDNLPPTLTVSGVTGQAASKTRGTRIVLHLRVANGRIEAAGFETLGCPHAIAASALVAEDLEGRAVGELADYSAAFLDKALPLPAEP